MADYCGRGVAACLAAVLMAGWGLAQEPAKPVADGKSQAAGQTPELPAEKLPPLFRFGLSETWRPESDFSESGGSMGYWTTGVSLRADTFLAKDLSLSPSVNYDHTSFHWSDDQTFLPGAGDPFTDLHSLRLNADLRYWFSREYGALVGAGVGVSGEDDALGNAWLGQGRLAWLFRPNQDISLGLGGHYAAGMTEYSFMPYIFADWRLSDAWRFTSMGPMIRLGYGPTRALNLGVFGAYDGHRWRLGKDASPSKGYVQVRGVKAGIDARLALTEWAGLTLETGLDLSRRIKADDDDNERVASDYLGTTPFVGLRLNIAF